MFIRVVLENKFEVTLNKTMIVSVRPDDGEPLTGKAIIHYITPISEERYKTWDTYENFIDDLFERKTKQPVGKD